MWGLWDHCQEFDSPDRNVKSLQSNEQRDEMIRPNSDQFLCLLCE